MIKMIAAVTVALAFATSAQAIPRTPLHQSESTVTAKDAALAEYGSMVSASLGAMGTTAPTIATITAMDIARGITAQTIGATAITAGPIGQS